MTPVRRGRGGSGVAILLLAAIAGEWRDATADGDKIVLKGPRARCRDVAFAPDGSRLAAAYDREVVLWDLSSAEEVWRAENVPVGDQCLGFAKGGQVLYVASYVDGHVRAFDAASGAEKPELRIEGGARFASGALALSPDGKWLAIGYGKPMGNLEPDEATKNAMRRLRLWNLEKNALERTIDAGNFLGHVAFSPASDLLAAEWLRSGEVDPANGLHLWSVASGEPVADRGLFNPFAFSPDGMQLYAAENQVVVVLSAVKGGTREPTARWSKAHTADIRQLELNADGTLLATAATRALKTPDPWVRLWDTRTGKRVGGFKSDPKETESLAFSPDGKRLAVGGLTTLKVHDVAPLLK
jgi:WD40 repeat protein